MKTILLFRRGRHLFCPLLIGCLLFLAQSARSSDRLPAGATIPILQTTITGIVSDITGPLPGVTVTLKGSSISTVTDEKGNFSIKAMPSDILLFSFIGYADQEFPVESNTLINIVLKADSLDMQEVEVNAGYYSVRESERTGSISRITAKAIEIQPVTNVLAAMQGRMAGVSITQTTGVPGGGFDIKIRGQNSLRADGNQPLYVVDGLPFSSESLGNLQLSGPILGGAGTSPLNSINPSDIESIEILKDADATAIYGSRGANGVVLITTKRGKRGKTQFSFNTYTGAGVITKNLKLLNTSQYLEMREEAFANDGLSELPAWAYDMNGTWDRNRQTDWQKELIGGTAITRNVEAGVSGGSENTQFLIRGTNFSETTVFPGDFSYGKTALHFNINHNSEDGKFAVNLSGNYVADKNDLLNTDLTRLATSLAPNAPALYSQDGSLNWENSTWDNPLRLLEGKYLAKTKGLYFGSVISYRLLDDLEARVTAGYNDTRLEESSTTPSTIYNPAFGLTSAASSAMSNLSGQQSWSLEPQLNWKKTIGKSRIDLLAGASFQERKASQLAVYASGFSSNSLIDNIGAASFTQILSSGTSEYRYAAFFGRANYTYDSKYILNLTGRRDGSSRFGPGNRFATFGAVGGAWLFGREQFMENRMPFLSFGKLRASYGTTGSDQIGDYMFLNTYTPTGVAYQGTIGLEPSRLFNPDFSWEVNRKLEIALELGFLKDRIFATGAYFRNRSSSQLVGIPLPGTTGFPSIQANLDATVANSGLELELRTVNFDGAFKWTTSLNLTLPKNELVSFPGLEGSVYANQYVIGEPLGIVKAYEFTGVDPETGIYTFKDFNGDGRLTANEDRQKIIDTSPDYFGGLQNSLSYKNWQLGFLFQFVKQLGVNANATSDLPGTAGNVPAYVLDRWQEPGDSSTVHQFTAGLNSSASTAFFSYYTRSDAAYSDASFVRLKNLSLSYTLPASVLKKAACRLYFQGQNLLTFTNFKGADPENQMRGRLPSLRVLTVGTQINF